MQRLPEPTRPRSSPCPRGITSEAPSSRGPISDSETRSLTTVEDRVYCYTNNSTQCPGSPAAKAAASKPVIVGSSPTRGANLTKESRESVDRVQDEHSQLNSG